jgi:hypothetical protein
MVEAGGSGKWRVRSLPMAFARSQNHRLRRETRSTKSEIPARREMPETAPAGASGPVWVIGASCFEFVSDFDIRISSFPSGG